MINKTGVILAGVIVSMASAQNVKYTTIANGGKLPYGKAVTITGDLKDFKCGDKTIADAVGIATITVTWLGQTTPAATATISGTSSWSVALGSLPPDTAVNLQFKVTGKMNDATKDKVVSALAGSDDFQRALATFYQMTLKQSTSVVNEEAERLLSSISDKTGALTQALGGALACASATTTATAAVANLRANLPALFDLNNRLDDLKFHYKDQFTAAMSASDAYELIKQKSLKDTEKLIFIQKFTRDYEKVRDGLAVDVVSQWSLGVQQDISSTTTDFDKYAGVDVGAVYVPRINELRQFFMVNVYPWGPVVLDSNGLMMRNWKQRTALAFGVSLGDLSSNANSRVKKENAFVYGLSYRINKYFRITAGGVLYRESAPGSRLLNEFAFGPSIDITALPGLKQVFASASGKSDTSGSSTKQADTSGNNK